MVAAGGPCCGDPFSATAWLWAEPGGGLLLWGGVLRLPPNAASRPVGGTNPPVSSARAARPTPKIAAAGATGLRAGCKGPQSCSGLQDLSSKSTLILLNPSPSWFNKIHKTRRSSAAKLSLAKRSAWMSWTSSNGRLVPFLTAPVEDQDGPQTPTSAAAVAPQTPSGAAAFPPGDIRRYFRVVSVTAERPVWTRTRSDTTAQWVPGIRLCCRVR